MINGSGLKPLKDLNFEAFAKSTEAKGKIDIEEIRKKELLDKIEKDSAFLRKHNLIDYSLLLF